MLRTSLPVIGLQVKFKVLMELKLEAETLPAACSFVKLEAKTPNRQPFIRFRLPDTSEASLSNFRKL